MEIFSISKLLFFLIFFMPGFVSIKVYDLFIASPSRDFSKALLEAIAYSAINFALLSGIIWIMIYDQLYLHHPFLFTLLSVCVLFIGPCLWPIFYLKLMQWKWVAKHTIGPIKRPWDWFFNQKQPAWVIVTLTDGRKIGGVFAENSYASSFPLPEQIYLEQIWALDEKNQFLHPLEGSKGVIILGKDMSTVEFFTNEVRNG